MNILWTKPHVLFFGEIHLQPGEPGNQVSAAVLAKLRKFPLFRDCEAMRQIVVREDVANAFQPIISAVVDTGDAEKEVAARAAAKKQADDEAAKKQADDEEAARVADKKKADEDAAIAADKAAKAGKVPGDKAPAGKG